MDESEEIEENNNFDQLPKYTIDEAIDLAGGFGKSQISFIMICVLNFLTSGFWLYPLNLLTLNQVYRCYDEKSQEFHNYSKAEDICEFGRIKDQCYFNDESERSIYNWISDMDLECAPGWKTSLFGSLFFAGVLLGSFVLTFFSKYGRRINTLVGGYISMICYVVLIFANNLYARYVFFTLMGFCFFKNIQSYILSSEYVSKNKRVYVTTITLCFNGLVLPITAFYFKFISKEWKYLYYCYGGVSIITTILNHFLLESPRFLYEKERYPEARIIVDKLARINGSQKLVFGKWIFDKEYDDTQEDDGSYISDNDENNCNLNETINTSSIAESRSTSVSNPLKVSMVEYKESPCQIMREDPIIFINLLIIMCSFASTTFNNYLLGFNIRNFGGNLYYNSWAFGFSNFFGKLIATAVRVYLPTKISLMIMLTIIITFGFFLIFFENIALIAISIGMIELGIGGSFTLIYYINVEYFPLLFVSFAFAICQVGGRSSAIASYLLSDLKEPYPMVLLVSTGLVSMLTLFCLSKPNYKTNIQTSSEPTKYYKLENDEKS